VRPNRCQAQALGFSSRSSSQAVNKGQSVNDEVIIEMFRKEIEDDHNNKPRTKLYKEEALTALKKSWPELYLTGIARISRKDCDNWAARYGKEYSATRFKGASGVVAEFLRLPSSMATVWIIRPNEWIGGGSSQRNYICLRRRNFKKWQSTLKLPVLVRRMVEQLTTISYNRPKN
jgi:hypothetical protein